MDRTGGPSEESGLVGIRPAKPSVKTTTSYYTGSDIMTDAFGTQRLATPS